MPKSESNRLVHWLHIVHPVSGRSNGAGFAELLPTGFRDLERFNDVVTLETCPDVYRGLARLGRAGPADFDAVVVDLKTCGPLEMEFFAIARRLLADLPIYVVGGSDSDGRIESAVRLGATGRFDPEQANLRTRDPFATPSTEFDERFTEETRTAEMFDEPRLFPSDSIHQETVKDTEPTQDRFPDRRDLAGTPFSEGNGSRTDHATDLEPEEGAEPLLSDHDSEEPVRVPWLQYADAPQRIAPQRIPPAPDDARPVRRPSSEPLLTPEELRALLEDDGPWESEESPTISPSRPARDEDTL